MGRKRRFKTPTAMVRAWEEYKQVCDSNTVKVTMFVEGEKQVVEDNRPLTYTIEGFLTYCKMSRQAFYKTYTNDERYNDAIQQMREECEVDARQKFETGQIPSKLAALWMCRYGYATNTNGQATERKEGTRFEDL